MVVSVGVKAPESTTGPVIVLDVPDPQANVLPLSIWTPLVAADRDPPARVATAGDLNSAALPAVIVTGSLLVKVCEVVNWTLFVPAFSAMFPVELLPEAR